MQYVCLLQAIEDGATSIRGDTSEADVFMVSGYIWSMLCVTKLKILYKYRKYDEASNSEFHQDF